MSLRDEVETVLRSWNAHEVGRGAAPVIDFDCHPSTREIVAADSRLYVYRQLLELQHRAEEADDIDTARRTAADLAYLRALMGERAALEAYVEKTQGCGTAGWPDDYVDVRGALARDCLDALGIGWRSGTDAELREAEGVLDAEAAPDAIHQAATEFESAVREITGARAPYHLTIETDDVDAYWAYWLDGAGDQIRLRLNLRNARFTKVRARQFALHEVLGHGLQFASLAARCATEDVSWVRLLSVHTQHQVLFEGLAQALPLFVAPDDEALATRVRLDHYLQLVRAELHLAINAGTPVDECARHARSRVPFWTDNEISNMLSDRGADPLLRSYLWSHPAGIDWFIALAEAEAEVTGEVLRAAYRDPLTPDELAALWPDGPPVGGPGRAVRLRHPAVP